MAKVTLSIGDNTWKKFRIYCIEKDKVASRVIEEWMNEVMGKSKRKEG